MIDDKRKIVLYIDSAGSITDAGGTYIGCNSMALSVGNTGINIDDLTKLKEAGFSADEILTLWKKGAI